MFCVAISRSDYNFHIYVAMKVSNVNFCYLPMFMGITASLFDPLQMKIYDHEQFAHVDTSAYGDFQ